MRTVALTVRTRFSEPLHHFERCGSTEPLVRLCGGALETAAAASVDGVNTDVSEKMDIATVRTQCGRGHSKVQDGARKA